ncbi:hypothetical protein LDENG_00250400 [Lucifuga dentata]|nr:hypothetical protein LDENG_00250400 [Lucifuga dentata]
MYLIDPAPDHSSSSTSTHAKITQDVYTHIKGPYHPFCMFEPNIFNFHMLRY